MTTQLLSLDDLAVIPSAVNFLLLELPKPFLALSITAELRRRGMLIRDCSSTEGCTARMVRIAVRTKPDNDRLLAALAGLLRRE